ncbi:MAG TPA: TIGR04255 family protein, partial [Urbifossiella sp.]
MRFPDAQRLVFVNPPLTEVVSQLRFPTILRFDTLPPAEFQENLREAFPFYAIETPTARPVANSAMITIRGASSTIPVTEASPKTPVHLFIAADRLSAMRLSNCELSFACQKYLGWEVFSDKLIKAMDALVRLYKPVFFHHICVKYNNAIQRSKFGLQDE